MGIENDGLLDVVVICFCLSFYCGVVIFCGMNLYLGDYDFFYMVVSVIDEVICNVVVVGVDLDWIVIFDNFCWGYIDCFEIFGCFVCFVFVC